MNRIKARRKQSAGIGLFLPILLLAAVQVVTLCFSHHRLLKLEEPSPELQPSENPPFGEKFFLNLSQEHTYNGYCQDHILSNETWERSRSVRRQAVG